jgi:hypothetical protein
MTNKLILFLLLVLARADAQMPATPAPTSSADLVAAATAKHEQATQLAALLHPEAVLSPDSTLGARRAKLQAAIRAQGLTPELLAQCERWKVEFERAQKQ